MFLDNLGGEALVLILILVVVLRVLLGGLGEVNDLAAGAAANDVVEVDLLHVVIVGCRWLVSRRVEVIAGRLAYQLRAPAKSLLAISLNHDMRCFAMRLRARACLPRQPPPHHRRRHHRP